MAQQYTRHPIDSGAHITRRGRCQELPIELSRRRTHCQPVHRVGGCAINCRLDLEAASHGDIVLGGKQQRTTLAAYMHTSMEAAA